MTAITKPSIGFAFCGSFCTIESATAALTVLLPHYRITPIFSEAVQHTNTRFGKADAIMQKIESLCGTSGIKSIVEAETIGPKKLFDLLIIAPCTGNTLAKLSLGIIDATVPMAAKAHLRNARPLLIAPASNDALSVGLRRRRIRELPLLLTIAGGILLALPGAWLAMRLDAALLRRAFGGLMLLSGLVALFGRRHKNM